MKSFFNSIMVAALCLAFAQPSFATRPSPQDALDRHIGSSSNNAGAVLLIKSEGQNHIYTSGHANQKQNIALTKQHLFHIASLTKMYTAVLIYQLIEDKKLNLNDKIAALIGDPLNGALSNYQDVTIQMALEHSSGMPDFLGAGFEEQAILRKNYNWTSWDVLKLAAKHPATHISGQAYLYNSAGYVLLGEVLKTIYKSNSLNAIFDEHIFTPLSLNHSYFPAGIRPRNAMLARGYRDGHDYSDIHWGENLADGGLVSSVGDLEHFFTALFETNALLSQTSLDHMMGKTMPLPLKSEGGRGLMVINRHASSNDNFPLFYGHFGRYLGYRTAAFYNPLNGDMFILLANSSHFNIHRFMQDIGILAPYN